ncbi:hypothetical protein [Streptomyces nigrescens]|uniref:hypothetical protein n=1 Tax=Streptomyces nigrescens TaxID=1920 RepID=UPI0036FFDCA6
MNATTPHRTICLHPPERSAFDAASRRVYCTVCYGARTSPLPVGPLNLREMDKGGLTPVVDAIFADLPEVQACAVFDQLMDRISQDGPLER